LKRVIESPDLAMDFAPATAGDIAVINLDSARRRSWSRFWRTPDRPGIAETIVEQELLTAQFVGDLTAFDRLEILVNQLARANPEGAQTHLVAAQVACATHRFTDARVNLAQAVARGAPSDASERLSLGLHQATGNEIPKVLEARRKRAAQPGRWEELVPLGALLADRREFEEAERTYRRALREYQDVSPFALAWVCFQLGVLWGELVPEAQLSRAEQWYRKAIEYLPCYVKARVHLAEIYSRDGRTEDAQSLLIPAVSSGDPEVRWRLADIKTARGNFADADAQMQVARRGFEILLGKHLLAFADHGAEFYSGSGDDVRRAFELARLNVSNRPTLRAFEQAYATAIRAGEWDGASKILQQAKERWGGTPAFGLSSMAQSRPDRIQSDEKSLENAVCDDPSRHLNCKEQLYDDRP
jgi:tetratricopeptide (TPR) repeat protein